MSVEASIRERINENVTLYALGNSKRTLADVAADLIFESGLKFKVIASDCFLCTSTVRNLATGKTKRPLADTVERVLRNFEYQLDMTPVKLAAKFANQPKEVK
jgi:hypothetical protein